MLQNNNVRNLNSIIVFCPCSPSQNPQAKMVPNRSRNSQRNSQVTWGKLKQRHPNIWEIHRDCSQQYLDQKSFAGNLLRHFVMSNVANQQQVLSNKHKDCDNKRKGHLLHSLHQIIYTNEFNPTNNSLIRTHPQALYQPTSRRNPNASIQYPIGKYKLDSPLISIFYQGNDYTALKR